MEFYCGQRRRWKLSDKFPIAGAKERLVLNVDGPRPSGPQERDAEPTRRACPNSHDDRIACGSLGRRVDVRMQDESGSWRCSCHGKIQTHAPEYDIVRQECGTSRTLCLAPLFGPRRARAGVMPGGCPIGAVPMDIHTDGSCADAGAEIDLREPLLIASPKARGGA